MNIKFGGNNIRNRKFNVNLGTSFSVDCKIDVLYEQAIVLRIRFDKDNTFLGAKNNNMFLTSYQRQDTIIWIRIKYSNDFYLINAASNLYLSTANTLVNTKEFNSIDWQSYVWSQNNYQCLRNSIPKSLAVLNGIIGAYYDGCINNKYSNKWNLDDLF